MTPATRAWWRKVKRTSDTVTYVLVGALLLFMLWTAVFP